MLQALGFARPQESAGHLRSLARGPEHAIAAVAPRRRELLERLGPLLLDEIRELADPDLALMNLASFIAAIGAHTSFLELLEQHPATRRVVLSLFASSAYLSTIFIRHPDMIDTLVRSDLARPRRSLADLDEELRALIVASPDLESRLDAIRAFRHQEFLRIAIADLAGDLDADAVHSELSLLAEVVLRRALELARAESPRASRFRRRWSWWRLRWAGWARPRCLITRTSISFLSTTTGAKWPRTAAWPPPGSCRNSSPCSKRARARATPTRSICGFAPRATRGRWWPRSTVFATTIAPAPRPCGSARHWCGRASSRANPQLGAEVEAARREFVFGRGLRREEVAEIAAMRLRIERELGADGRGRLNIKQGRGGLVDVEFLTQMMALRYGHAHPELTSRATVALVRGIGQCGLLEPGAAAQLETDYRFLSRLENRLRIETDQAAWALSTGPESLGPLARRMGYRDTDGAARLLAEVERLPHPYSRDLR